MSSEQTVFYTGLYDRRCDDSPRKIIAQIYKPLAAPRYSITAAAYMRPRVFILVRGGAVLFNTS